MIRKINGKGTSSVNHLFLDNEAINTPIDIAYTLADTFANKSSSENYSEKFQKFKAREEKKET